MASIDLVLGILLLLQTGFGVLGNSFLLGLYTITFFTDHRLRPIDLLLSHLAFVNDLVLLSKGIPQTMAALGLKNFLDDVGCKLVFYIHWVARCLSLCTTCLLSGFQAITLSPRSSSWVEIKARMPKCIGPLCFLCWVFHLIIHSYILLIVKGPTEIKNFSESIDLIYCIATDDIPFLLTRYILIVSLPDILCVGIMVGSSGYMVFVLLRHHHKVQYIHDNNLTPSNSPESRASQTILLLVSMFFSFYSLNSILILCMKFEKSTSLVVYISVFFAACFPAYSPFVLILSDSQVRKYSLALWDKINLPVE